VYYAHQFPVWDLKFAPLGYYFASASNDRMAAVWNQKIHTPVRLLSGHMSDVFALEWHPNMQYVATGSQDSTVKLFGVEDGECYRTMFTTDSPVRVLKFTRNGYHLIAGNDNG